LWNRIDNLRILLSGFHRKLQIVFLVRCYSVTQFRIEPNQYLFRNAGEKGHILKFHRPVGFYRFEFAGLELRIRCQIEAISSRITDNVECGQETRHVACGLVGQLMVQIPEAIQIVDVLPRNDSHHPAFTAVVSGQNGQPVSEHAMQFLQITDCRLGRLVGIHSLIDPFIAI